MNDKVLRCRAYFPESSWYTWVHLIGTDDRPICGAEAIQGARLEARVDIEDEERDVCQKCLQVEAQYSVQLVRGGRIRPRGPREWLFTVTDELKPLRWPDEVLRDCMRIVHKALAEKDPEMWHLAFVEEFKQTGEGKYRYLVHEEATN